MRTFSKRVVRAIQLDPTVYLEIKEDKSSMAQATILILLSSIASGIGSVGGYTEKIPLATLLAFIGWFVWPTSIYLFGARFFPEPETKTDLASVFRVTWFAGIPELLKLLAFSPAVSGIILFGATVWTFGATVIATQQVLNYRSVPRSISISLIGWIFYQGIIF